MSTSKTRTYNALLTTTFDQVTGELYDIISEDIPFFYQMNKKKRKVVDGGAEIRRTVMPRFNTDGGSFAKGDVVSATDSNPVEPAFWQWAHYVKPIILFDQDAAHNAGEAEILDIGKAKMDQARISLRKDLNVDMYLNGGGAQNRLEGMKLFANKDTYTTDSYGGLSRATYSTWRPSYSGSALGKIYDTSDGIEYLLNQLRTRYIDVSTQGFGEPDLILTSVTGIDYYEQRVFDKLRVYDQDTADAGFHNWKFKNAVMIADPYLNSTDGTLQGSNETFYGFNTKTWELVVQKGREFRLRGPLELPEQIGVRWDLLIYLQMICTNPRCNFMITGASDATA